MTTCPIHGQPWKVVPAGVSSKTGQAYNSFLCCPIQGCKERPPKANGASFSGNSPQAPTVPVKSSDGALKAACLSFAAFMYKGAPEMTEDALALARKVYAEWSAL